MRNSLFLRSFFIFLTLLLTACVSSPPPSIQASRLTAGEVKVFIKKGITSQADINEHFGAPNLVTQNGEGNDVWSYNKQSNASNSSSGYGTAIFFGGSSSSSSAGSKSFDLIITFNKKGIVDDYKMVQSAY